MPTVFRLLVLLLSCSSLEAVAPYVVGEKLYYDIHWSFFKVGTAEMELQTGQTPGGDPALIIVNTARTNGFADKIYRVRNTVTSWMAPDSSRALHYTKQEEEGKRERDVVVTFDFDAKTAVYTNKGVALDPVPLPDFCHDPLSVVYAARLRPWVVGSSFIIPVTNGKRSFEAEIKVVRRERIKTEMGPVDAILLEPDIKDLGGVFNKSKKAKVEFWFSDDARRLPLIMKSSVSVGSFSAELVRIEQPTNLVLAD